ncbi:hypothetical protein [Streptomyces sp. NPDC003710]
MTNPAIWPAWAGFALGVINLGITVSDGYLRVPLDHHIGADLPQLRRDLSRALFRAGHGAYLVANGLPLDDDLREEIQETRDALSDALVETADTDLAGHLAMAIDRLDAALAKPKVKRWREAEEHLDAAFTRLQVLATRRVWRWQV